MPLRFDLQAQADLLAFLVISHLATKFATGEWMSLANTVESSVFWLQSTARDNDVIQRVMLASRALAIAKTFEAETHLTLNSTALASIFDSNLRLDFSSAVTRDIHDRCLKYLTLK